MRVPKSHGAVARVKKHSVLLCRSVLLHNLNLEVGALPGTLPEPGSAFCTPQRLHADNELHVETSLLL